MASVFRTCAPGRRATGCVSARAARTVPACSQIVGIRWGSALTPGGGRTGGGRRLGAVALVAFAAVDIALIAQAIHHTRAGHPASTVALAPGPPSAPDSSTGPTASTVGGLPSAFALTVGSAPAIASSYGSCHGGSATVDGVAVTGLAHVLAVTGTASSAVLVGVDDTCKRGVWKHDASGWARVRGLKVPTGVAAAASGAAWVVGDHGGLIAGSSGTMLGQPLNPCAGTGMSPKFAAAWSATKADVFCALAATTTGQARLVFGTTDGGAHWSELSGARSVGPRAEGADMTGSMATAGSSQRPSSARRTRSASCSPNPVVQDCNCERAATPARTGRQRDVFPAAWPRHRSVSAE